MTNKNLILTRKIGDKVVVHKDNQVLCVLTVTNISKNRLKAFENNSKTLKL